MAIVPHHYQHKGVDWILARDRSALWWDMGLGKTLTTLLALDAMLDDLRTGRVLIVSTPRVIRRVWPKEIRKFPQFGYMTSRIIHGAGWRNRALRDKSMIHLCTFDQLATRVFLNEEGAEKRRDVGLVELWGDKWPYDTVILDESSMIKNPTSRRFKALKKAHKYVDTLVQLTGTPSPNSLLELWSQMYLLDGGYRLGHTYTAFKARWFQQEDYQGYRYGPRPGADEEIHRLCAELCMSMSARDYLDLPPVTNNTITVQLPKARMQEYRELEREMYLALESGENIEAVNAGVLTGKCRQFAAGAVYVGPEDKKPRDWEAVHSAKLEALDEIVEECGGNPLVVAYNFHSDLARLRKRYPKALVMDKTGRAIERFQQGESNMLFIHPQSAGHGIDGLQYVCNHLAWFSVPWSLEQYLQTCGRIDRQGQSLPVIIHHLVAENTVDERIVEALTHKRSVLDALLYATRYRYAA